MTEHRRVSRTMALGATSSEHLQGRSVLVSCHRPCEEIPPHDQPEPPLPHEGKFKRLSSCPVAGWPGEEPDPPRLHPPFGNCRATRSPLSFLSSSPNTPSSLSRSPQDLCSRPFPASFPFSGHISADCARGQRDKTRVRARFPSEVALEQCGERDLPSRSGRREPPAVALELCRDPGKGEPQWVCSSRSKRKLIPREEGKLLYQPRDFPHVDSCQ